MREARINKGVMSDSRERVFPSVYCHRPIVGDCYSTFTWLVPSKFTLFGEFLTSPLFCKFFALVVFCIWFFVFISWIFREFLLLLVSLCFLGFFWSVSCFPFCRLYWALDLGLSVIVVAMNFLGSLTRVVIGPFSMMKRIRVAI